MHLHVLFCYVNSKTAMYYITFSITFYEGCVPLSTEYAPRFFLPQ